MLEMNTTNVAHAEKVTNGRYVACYFRTPKGERYSAIGHGWIIRTPDYVGSMGHDKLTDATADCGAWERTGFRISEGYTLA